LDEGELGVPRPGRHVDDEVVELAPLNLLEELPQDPGDEGAAHDGRLLVLEEEAEAHEADAVGLEGDDLLLAALARDARLALLAERDGDVLAVDVRVQEADALTGRGEGGGQVRRDCGLPDAALAGAHGD